MNKDLKIGRNDICPCGTGKKFKQCCYSKVDWNEIFRSKCDWRPYLSIRGRNLHFINRIAEILQLGSHKNLSGYKKGFTEKAVREIHEAIFEVWAPNSDIKAILESTSDDVSGLYIGDYDIEYISRGIVRHSIYANKILVVDPFIYPRSVRDEYNPILEPDQYRTQTLKNVNFWLSLLPWIESGLIEIIRTPADFDHRLNWESMQRQRRKFEEDAELQVASERSVDELKERHMEKQVQSHLLLSAPDSYIEGLIKELGLEKDGYTAKDFLKYVNNKRESDPNFLEPVGPGSDGQLHMMSTGASYDIAQLTASITKSYLVTDIYSKWREIEIDRSRNNAENRVWSPFAKAFQESPLKFLNNLQMNHALQLRTEGRLESLRSFLLKVWKQARTEAPFDETNARLFAEQLREEVALAKDEWGKIDQDLLKMVGGEAGAGLLAAGPLIAAGHGLFVGAAAVAAGAATLAASYRKRKQFPDRYPAAFFMNIEKTQ
jgi:AraC-like DNA-binding protein